MVSDNPPMCAKCTIVKCNYPNNSGQIPSFCAMKNYQDVKQETLKRLSSDNEIREIDAATMTLSKKGRDDEGPKWTRIREVIEYAKLLKYKKIGLAFCVGLHDEARKLQHVLEKSEFAVVSVSCTAGKNGSIECNPLLQAEILNREKTQLNIMFGLCVGHDILFIKNSKADVTPLVVKDRVLAHNPVAALYSEYLYRKLLPKE